jgi:hypothetical protein
MNIGLSHPVSCEKNSTVVSSSSVNESKNNPNRLSIINFVNIQRKPQNKQRKSEKFPQDFVIYLKGTNCNF